ncbi:Hydrolase PA4440, alpha/beta fold family [hydrothermal vent metagenome]|uniref:Hydrolase PA4440, alpha/beta fold family n=1 Tax=hydrothermal vent metagenome TaxID=652676 RepID=A0A3B0YHE7_9ZZZZ
MWSTASSAAAILISALPESIAGPAGTLQVLTELPDGEPQAVAVICHPHPLHGGSLNNKIVHQLARTFRGMGAVSVRFNFRGVGDSKGNYDQGYGELQDLLAVVAWATQHWPGLPLWLGGFSFGGFIAVQAATELNPQRLVTVAPAVNYFPDQPVTLASTDWLLIQGDADDIVPWSAVQAWVLRLSTPPALTLISGASHFFHGRLNELRQAAIDHYPPM